MEQFFFVLALFHSLEEYLLVITVFVQHVFPSHCKKSNLRQIVPYNESVLGAGSFLSREEGHFSMHTKQDKVLIMNYYPKLSIYITFIRTFSA